MRLSNGLSLLGLRSFLYSIGAFLLGVYSGLLAGLSPAQVELQRRWPLLVCVSPILVALCLPARVGRGSRSAGDCP